MSLPYKSFSLIQPDCTQPVAEEALHSVIHNKFKVLNRVEEH